MDDKFNTVPIEEDTELIFSQEMKLEEYDVVYQKWFWGDIYGESMIFLTQDILQLGNNELLKQGKSSPIFNTDSEITISKSDDFAFMNFNFKSY